MFFFIIAAYEFKFLLDDLIFFFSSFAFSGFLRDWALDVAMVRILMFECAGRNHSLKIIMKIYSRLNLTVGCSWTFSRCWKILITGMFIDLTEKALIVLRL